MLSELLQELPVLLFLLLIGGGIAAYLGLPWWGRIERACRRPAFGPLEVAILLLASVPGLLLVVLALREQALFALPLGLAVSLGMGAGALLGWLYSYAKGSKPSRLYRTVTMVSGIMLTLPWCAVVVVAPPGFIESAMSANETAAPAYLRAYFNAQGTFHRQAWYGEELKGIYANPVNGKGFVDLYQIGGIGSGGAEPQLIDRAFAEATSPDSHRSGYYFAEIAADANGPYDYTKQFGLCAVPAEYRRDGRSTYIVDNEGVVYGKDNGGKPVTVWPDIEAEGWFPCE